MDIFHNPTKSIPKKDANIIRIELDKSDLGARKSFISDTIKKNEYSIKHVAGK